MFKAIELTKIDREQAMMEPQGDQSMYTENEENEGQMSRQGVVGNPVSEPLVSPVTIAVDSIRCFYPRKDNKPGTRITFKDGGGFAVTETYQQVKDALSRFLN